MFALRFIRPDIGVAYNVAAVTVQHAYATRRVAAEGASRPLIREYLALSDFYRIRMRRQARRLKSR